MAWRTSCPILTSSLHSEDLMSDIEPLPASGPNSAPSTPSQVYPSYFEDLSNSRPGLRSQPASPYSHRSGSSEVTAQLYASLRQSREIEAQAREHLKSPVSGRCNFLESNEVLASTDKESLSQGRTGPLQHMAEANKGHNLTSSPLSSPCSQKHSTSSLPAFGLELRRQYSADMFQERPNSPPDRHSDVDDERSMANQNTQGSCVEYESLPEEMIHKLSSGDQASTFRRGASRHISEMERVRSHLQGIIRASRDPPYRDLLLSTAGLGDKEEELSFASDSTATLLNARPLQEISPPLSVPSMEELFPRYASMHPRSSQDPSSYNEMQLIRDLLEKERTRRKHLERHIQDLQNRILELQQQLAIAVSADKKKDVMIEQLDKTLAKVVEGWNKHEGERNNAMRQLQEEKEVAEQARRHHQDRLSKLEESLSHTTQSLEIKQLEATEQQKQIEMLEKEKKILVRSLDSEKQHGQILQSQQDEAVAGKLHVQKQMEALRATMKEEQEAWAQTEKQLEESYQMTQEELKRQLGDEKVWSQKAAQQAQEAKQVLVSAQAKVQQLEAELDNVRRERESLQLDVTLVKTRYDSQRMKLESELKAAMEQEVAKRLAEVHEENSRQITTMREQHRKQQGELNSRHEKELTNRLSKFKAELLERDEKMRRIKEDYEIRLAKFQEDARELTDAKKKLESQRSEMVDRLQCIMQAHWNEALRVLMSESSPRCTKAHHEEKGLYDSKLSFDDPQNPSTQKNMAVPPSKGEPPSSSEPIQRRLFEFEAMKESLSKAVSDMQTGEGSSKTTSQPNIPTREKPKATVHSFHGGQVEMPKGPSRVAANNDDNRWAGQTVNPLVIPMQQNLQPTAQKLLGKEFQNLTEGNSLLFPNHQHNWSENPGSFFNANQNNFYPLIANGRLTADLSQLLNHSFASQMSFHPLEPQVDETGFSTAYHLHSRRADLLQELAAHEYFYPGFIRQLKAVLGYPHDEIAEHPLTDDTEENITASEGTISEGSSFQNFTAEVPERSFVPPADFQRPSLQHCIRMLLDRAPGDPLNENTRSPTQSFSQISFLQGESLGYRERSTGIWDQINEPPAEQQLAPRAPQAVQKTKVSEIMPQTHSREPCTPPKTTLASQVGNRSPKNAAEISHLYPAHKGQPMSEELFAYLQVMEQGGLDVKSEGIQTYHGNSSARRSLDPKLNEAVRKEVVSGQVVSQRRPSTTRASSEKPVSAKAVKKSALVPTQGSIKGNRSSVWR